MLVRKHVSHDGNVLLAVCDSELLGKQFEEGEAVLDLSGEFYKGEEADNLSEMIKNAYIVNAVGKESTGFLIKEGYLKDENIKTVDGIPHAQLVIVRE